MATIQQTLNEAIQRTVRKEVKAAMEQQRKINADLRKRIAELNKTVKEISAELDTKAWNRAIKKIDLKSETRVVRITKERIKQLRQKLGLTQGQFAELLDVNIRTVNCWESGKNVPDDEQKRKIAYIRDIGKRECAKMMAEKNIVPKGSKKAVPAEDEKVSES